MSNFDIDSLEKQFNLDEIKYEASKMRSRIKNLTEFEDPNSILQSNIERASAMLDRLEEAIDNGEGMGKGGIARLMEVAAKLIDSITTASSTMMSMTFNAQDVEYKEKVLSLKELEVQAKIAGQSPKALAQNMTQNNIVLTDRNSLLDLLSKGETPIPIETRSLND